MRDTFGKVVFYLFILAAILILVAYNKGSVPLLGGLFSGVNQLDLTATGRTSSGSFAGYPTGG